MPVIDAIFKQAADLITIASVRLTSLWRNNMKLALVSAAFLVVAFNACFPPAIAAPFICKTIKA